MKKNIVIAVLGVLCLTLLAIEAGRIVVSRIAAVNRRRDALDSRMRVLSDLEARLRTLEARLGERDEELARLRNAIGRHDAPDQPAAAMPSAVQRPPVAAEDDVAEEAVAPLDGLGEKIAGMLKDTNFLQSVMAQGLRSARTAGRVDREYRDFFTKRGLNEEQIARAMELVRKRDRLAVLPGLGELGQEGGVVSTRQIGGDTDEGGRDNELREMLGEEGYGEFERFHETRNARRMVNQFQDYLAADNLAIDDTQREELIDMFHATGAAYDGNDLSGGLTFSMNSGDEGSLEENIDNSLDKLVVKYDRLAGDASRVLSDGQSERLRSFLDQQLERKEMEGDMARNILPAIKIEGIEGLPVQGSVQVIAAPPVVVEE